MLATGKVAKKGALYPPKRIMDELDFKQGQRVRHILQGEKLVVERARDPFELALTGKKWRKTTVTTRHV